MTIEPISIADKILIRQAWFRFLNFALFPDSLSIVSIAENKLTHKPHIRESNLKSLRNRSTVVRYREHCTLKDLSARR